MPESGGAVAVRVRVGNAALACSPSGEVFVEYALEVTVVDVEALVAADAAASASRGHMRLHSAGGHPPRTLSPPPSPPRGSETATVYKFRVWRRYTQFARLDKELRRFARKRGVAFPSGARLPRSFMVSGNSVDVVAERAKAWPVYLSALLSSELAMAQPLLRFLKLDRVPRSAPATTRRAARLHAEAEAGRDGPMTAAAAVQASHAVREFERRQHRASTRGSAREFSSGSLVSALSVEVDEHMHGALGAGAGDISSGRFAPRLSPVSTPTSGHRRATGDSDTLSRLDLDTEVDVSEVRPHSTSSLSEYSSSVSGSSDSSGAEEDGAGRVPARAAPGASTTRRAQRKQLLLPSAHDGARTRALV